jgi:hypothetical protein
MTRSGTGTLAGVVTVRERRLCTVVVLSIEAAERFRSTPGHDPFRFTPRAVRTESGHCFHWLRTGRHFP